MPAKLDPDLDDIPDDLIQTECVTLVKKNQQQTKQHRNNPSKRSVKNFKCFRKVNFINAIIRSLETSIPKTIYRFSNKYYRIIS